jgi:hypothetical protein
MKNECVVLGCNAVPQQRSEKTYRLLSVFSLPPASWLDHEDGGNTFLRNVVLFLPNITLNPDGVFEFHYVNI